MMRCGRTATLISSAWASSNDASVEGRESREKCGEFEMVTAAILSGGPPCHARRNHPVAGGYAKADVEDRYGLPRPPQIAARRAKRRVARNDIGERSMSAPCSTSTKLCASLDLRDGNARVGLACSPLLREL